MDAPINSFINHFIKGQPEACTLVNATHVKRYARHPLQRKPRLLRPGA